MKRLEAEALGALRRRASDLYHEIRRYLGFPLRLRLDGTGGTRVVLFGLPYPGWNAVLADRTAWARARGVRDVIRIPAWPAVARWLARRDAVFIPIKDKH